MAEYENKPGWGNAFKNKFKTEDFHPEYRGEVAVHRDLKEGDVIEVSLKEKKTRGGDLYFSVKVKDRYVPRQEPAGKRGESPSNDKMDDDIPF